MRYALVAEHRPLFSVRAMCRCLRIHPSGFYAWLKSPLSKRAQEDGRHTYKTRDDAREDVFDYIKMFYNPIRKHARNGMLSPVDFEEQQKRGNKASTNLGIIP